MNEGVIIIVGRFMADGYIEQPALVKDNDPINGLDASYIDEHGNEAQVANVKYVSDVTEGEDYWRETFPEDFTDQKPVRGQIVWVSWAREEELSEVVMGIAATCPEPFVNEDQNLRVLFRTNRNRIRTLVAQSQASPCDSFWSVDMPAAVYCDD